MAMPYRKTIHDHAATARVRTQHGGPDCQIIGGKHTDQAVVEASLEASGPCAPEAARLANEQAREQGEALRLYWPHQIEKARYAAQRAERQYLAVEPENGVVARELERRWEAALQELGRVQRQSEQVDDHLALLSAEELEHVHLLGQELREVWDAETTEHRDRKRLLRTLIEEVRLGTEQEHYAVRIVWKGGATTEREVVRGPAGWAHRTPEDTVDLVRKVPSIPTSPVPPRSSCGSGCPSAPESNPSFWDGRDVDAEGRARGSFIRIPDCQRACRVTKRVQLRMNDRSRSPGIDSAFPAAQGRSVRFLAWMANKSVLS
jgi:hypothetical protein